MTSHNDLFSVCDVTKSLDVIHQDFHEAFDIDSQHELLYIIKQLSMEVKVYE